MDSPIADSLKRAIEDHPDAYFTLFTLSGHAISGHIAASGTLFVLTADKERAEVAADRIEAFSLRQK